MDPSDNDPEMALEIAVGNLEIDGFSGSDSEVDEAENTETERSEGRPGTLLEEKDQGTNSIIPRERMERLYSPSPAPSTTQSTVSDNVQPLAPIVLRQPTLNNIIEDKRTFNLFRRFLKDQCITRNLNFWLACEHYRKQVPLEGQQSLYEIAKAIYVKFIKSSATQRVTLLDQTRKKIKMGLELQRVTPDLFNTAQLEIWGVMTKNELRQFLVSGMFADCSSFVGLSDSLTVASSVYTPSMANPAMGVCGGGSLQHSGSEDSASLSSFSTESDLGPRSCVVQLSRPFPTSSRNAVSDCEDPRPRHARRSGRTHTGSSAYVTKDKSVTEEKFAALVQERLACVIKDREAMTKRVRERARQQRKNYEEIMGLEWFDLPEAFKYIYLGSDPVATTTQEPTNHLQVPYPKHTMSPLPTPQSTRNIKELGHINSLALREVQDALKDMEITNQVNESRRSFSRTSGCSSVLSTTSDSGVGDTLATSGLVTPQQDRLTAYINRQNTISDSIPERERDARAAAISLISGSPQPESLNPRVPNIRHHHPSDRHRRPVSNYPEAYSSDDSSSCFTMTSHSSASDLFIPRKVAQRPAYSDNDEPHHYSRYHHKHRQLHTPRRSSKVSAPSPIVEHQQMSNQMTTPTSTRSAPPPKDTGSTLVVYHLDQIPTPFAMRVPGSGITLKDFKDRVLKRTGSFRYFFKSFCEDVGEFLEECSDENAVLPLFQGKVIGRVERLE